MKSKVHPYFILLLVLILNLSFLIYFCVRKEILFVDEGFSYGVSNGTDSCMPQISEDQLCVYNPPIFHNQLTVQSDEKYQYAQILKNLQDHPPLYFMLFHTINAWFLDEFHKWTGLIFNLLFFVLTQIMIYALSRQFLSVKKSFLPVIFYGFSVAAVCTVVFIRSYMLLTFLTTSFFLSAVKLLQAEKDNKNRDFYLYFAVFCILIFLGSLTHYYFIMTAFIVCAGIWSILLYHRQYQKMCIFTIGTLFSVCLSPLLFLEVWQQLFKDKRILEIPTTLSENILSHQFNLKIWNTFISTDFLGTYFTHFPLTQIGVIIVGIYGIICLKKKYILDRTIILLTVSWLFSVIVISGIIPLELKPLLSVSKRYFFHLAPVFVLLSILLLNQGTKKLKYGFELMSGILLLFLFFSWSHPDFSVYFYNKDRLEYQYAKILADKTLLIQWKNDTTQWKMAESALFSLYAQRFMIFRDFDSECFHKARYDNDKHGTALMLEHTNISQACPYIKGYKLYFYTWSVCAYLS